MKIELRGVHFSERMSDETNCFSAMVWIDGRKAGEVMNHGTGGPNEYFFDTKELVAYAKTLPARVTDYGTFAVDADEIIDDLFQEWLDAKELKRLTAGRTTFKLKSDKEGEYRTIKVPFSPEQKAKVVAKYGDRIDFFLNERTSL